MSSFGIGSSGACCYPDGSCAVTTQADGTAVWHGEWTSCDLNPCPPAGDFDGDGDVDLADSAEFQVVFGQ